MAAEPRFGHSSLQASTASGKRWRRWIGLLAKVLAVSILVITVAVATTIVVARALLPNTCTVSEAQFAKLSMQMTYDTVKELLGCDGVLVSKQDHGQIVIEHYAWRGAAWPYGRLRLEFINHTLQGTQKLWLNLAVTIKN